MLEIIKAKVTEIIASSAVIPLKESETPSINYTSLAIVHAEADGGMGVEFIVPIPLPRISGWSGRMVKGCTYFFKCYKQLMKLPEFAQGFDFVGYLCIDIEPEN